MGKPKQPIALDRNCQHCGQPIVLSYTFAKVHRQEVLYCSMACYHAHRRETIGQARICRRCGKEFRNKQFNYCPECRRELAPANTAHVKAVDERYSKVCPVCGKTFYKPLADGMTQWRQRYTYCSRACSGAAHRKPYDICEACGKPITAVGIKRGAARYCSRKCYADARSNFTSWSLCKVCGETVSRRHRKFCSVECFNEWHQGPNHPLYVDGRSVHHQGVVWARRAAEVRARDQVCQHCGKPPKPPYPLDVHHIIPWRVSHDDSLENLIALCRSCHKKADHRFRQLAAETTATS